MDLDSQNRAWFSSKGPAPPLLAPVDWRRLHPQLQEWSKWPRDSQSKYHILEPQSLIQSMRPVSIQWEGHKGAWGAPGKTLFPAVDRRKRVWGWGCCGHVVSTQPLVRKPAQRKAGWAMERAQSPEQYVIWAQERGKSRLKWQKGQSMKELKTERGERERRGTWRGKGWIRYINRGKGQSSFSNWWGPALPVLYLLLKVLLYHRSSVTCVGEEKYFSPTLLISYLRTLVIRERLIRGKQI